MNQLGLHIRPPESKDTTPLGRQPAERRIPITMNHRLGKEAVRGERQDFVADVEGFRATGRVSLVVAATRSTHRPPASPCCEGCPSRCLPEEVVEDSATKTHIVLPQAAGIPAEISGDSTVFLIKELSNRVWAKKAPFLNQLVGSPSPRPSLRISPRFPKSLGNEEASSTVCRPIHACGKMSKLRLSVAGASGGKSLVPS